MEKYFAPAQLDDLTSFIENAHRIYLNFCIIKIFALLILFFMPLLCIECFPIKENFFALINEQKLWDDAGVALIFSEFALIRFTRMH